MTQAGSARTDPVVHQGAPPTKEHHTAGPGPGPRGRAAASAIVSTHWAVLVFFFLVPRGQRVRDVQRHDTMSLRHVLELGVQGGLITQDCSVIH